MLTRNRTFLLWISAVLPPWLVLAVILFGPTKIDIIERLFDVAPDNGDGSLESLSLVALLAAITGVSSLLFVGKRQI